MAEKCDFCQAVPEALVRELKALPRLKTVIVKARDVDRMKAAVRKSTVYQLIPLGGDPDPVAYGLLGPGLEEVLVEIHLGDSNMPDMALLLP